MVTLKDKISSLTSDSITVDFFVSLSRSSSWHLYTSSKTTEWWGKCLWTNHHPYTIGDWCVYKKCDYARLDV